jgi:hypothetical protein
MFLAEVFLKAVFSYQFFIIRPLITTVPADTPPIFVFILLMSFQILFSAEGGSTFITSVSGLVTCYGAGVDIFLSSSIRF